MNIKCVFIKFLLSFKIVTVYVCDIHSPAYVVKKFASQTYDFEIRPTKLHLGQVLSAFAPDPCK